MPVPSGARWSSQAGACITRVSALALIRRGEPGMGSVLLQRPMSDCAVNGAMNREPAAPASRPRRVRGPSSSDTGDVRRAPRSRRFRSPQRGTTRPTPLSRHRGGPTPTSRSSDLDVAVKEASQLGGSAKPRLLRGDYDDVEVGGAEAKHRPGVPARKRRAEAV